MERLPQPCEVIRLKSDGLTLEWQDKSRYFPEIVEPIAMYLHSSLSDYLYFKIEGRQLLVFDIFSGTSKNLIATPKDFGIKLLQCVPLTAERCFVLYQKDQKFCVSIISLETSENIYEFTATAYCIPDQKSGQQITIFGAAISVISSDTVYAKVVREKHCQLYIFKIYHFASSFKLQTTFIIPFCTFWYGIADEGCVFAQYNTSRMFTWIDCIATCNKNESVTKLENTGIKFEQNIQMSEHRTRLKTQPDGRWCGDSLFVWCPVTDRCDKKTTCIFIFQLSQRKWSTIQLDSPQFGRRYFEITTIDDGILTTFYCGQHCGNKIFNGTKCVLRRLPVTSPEMLFTLCWLKRNKFPLRKTASVYYDQ
ncbi:hypothetical protein M3Y97_00407000 [Aphelenchoides bicaudatus]|nr:hypothetical protein M3Y97_00407000 [Aphelenchoides bicaudatus]